MVVQCPTCQSKFRIADDKVTDRGVRVRCTSCKNVFQVRKPGAGPSEAAPGPGSTMDLSSLGAAAVARAGVAARPGAGAASKPGPARPAASRPAPVASRPPPATARSTNGTARRLEADDLFGMAELTGDAPLDAPARSSPPPPPPPAASKPPPKPMPNFDDIDIDVPDEPSGPPPPPPPAASKPPPPRTRPPPPPKAAAEPPPPPPADEAPPAPPEDAPPADGAAVKIGAFKSPALNDPFEGMNLGEPGTGAIEISTQPKKDKLAETAAAEVVAKTEPLPPPPPPEIPPGRDLVSSALTGLVGAALAIAVVIVAAISDDTSAGWLGFVRGNEIVATHVVSGLYDTASGKPVFFVRGRVENRGQKTRGPVRVTAELVSDGAAEAKAEAIAGAEPSPEDVWSLRSAADVEKLNHTLQASPVERKLQPGTSLPFFAVIPDPPQNLERHRLHVRVESVDAWTPPPPRKGR